MKAAAIALVQAVVVHLHLQDVMIINTCLMIILPVLLANLLIEKFLPSMDTVRNALLTHTSMATLKMVTSTPNVLHLNAIWIPISDISTVLARLAQTELFLTVTTLHAIQLYARNGKFSMLLVMDAKTADHSIIQMIWAKTASEMFVTTSLST